MVCSIGPNIEEIDAASTAEEVRRLNAKKAVLVKDLDAIDDISETMVNYSKSLAGDTVAPRQAERFFESLLTRTRDISSTRADLEEEILQLSRQIDVLSSSETKKKGKTNGEVTVVIMAKNATDVELRLTYRMSSPMLVELLPLTVLLPRQLSDTRHGLRRTSYTPLRKLVFPHRRYPCIIVPASHRALGKTGQTLGSH